MADASFAAVLGTGSSVIASVFPGEGAGVAAASSAVLGTMGSSGWADASGSCGKGAGVLGTVGMLVTASVFPGEGAGVAAASSAAVLGTMGSSGWADASGSCGKGAGVLGTMGLSVTASVFPGEGLLCLLQCWAPWAHRAGPMHRSWEKGPVRLL